MTDGSEHVDIYSVGLFKQLAARYDKTLREYIRNAPIGSVICTHPMTLVAGPQKYAATQYQHVIAPEDEPCGAPGRSMLGPITEQIKQLVTEGDGR